MKPWHGLNFISERPDDPVDMGIAIDPLNPSTAVLWMIDTDGVVHIESLMDEAGSMRLEA